MRNYNYIVQLQYILRLNPVLGEDDRVYSLNIANSLALVIHRLQRVFESIAYGKSSFVNIKLFILYPVNIASNICLDNSRKCGCIIMFKGVILNGCRDKKGSPWISTDYPIQQDISCNP